MKDKKLNASMTVEAAFIIPIVIFIIFALMYLAFQLHDRVRMETVMERALGKGDFLITGFSLGFENNFLLLLESLLLSFMWSLMLMLFKKINLKTSLPFLPFILTAFIIRVLPVMSF